jgi:hypothetical protein
MRRAARRPDRRLGPRRDWRRGREIQPGWLECVNYYPGRRQRGPVVSTTAKRLGANKEDSEHGW